MEIVWVKATNAWIFAGVENVIGPQFSNSLSDSRNKFDLLAPWDYYYVTNGCACVWACMVRCVNDGNLRHFISNILYAHTHMCTFVSIDIILVRRFLYPIPFVTIDHLMRLYMSDVYWYSYIFKSTSMSMCYSMMSLEWVDNLQQYEIEKSTQWANDI